MAAEDRMLRREEAPPEVSHPEPVRPGSPAPRPPARRPSDERSLADLLKELLNETRTLVRQEIALAKAEASEMVSKASRNVVLLVAGGLLAYVGLFALVAAAILALALVLPGWLSALLVGLVVLGVAFAVVQKGRKGLKNTDFSFERTVDTLEDDKRWLKEEVEEAKR